MSLGLNKWDLFLNLGLAYLDRQEFGEATTGFDTSRPDGRQGAA